METAKVKLDSEGLKPHLLRLDVCDDEDIQQAKKYVEKEFGRIDCLVNNAGIIIENNYTFGNIPKGTIMKTIETNALGPLSLIQNFSELLCKSENPRIVNVSSGMGSMTEMGSGAMAYRISKACLNVITIQSQHELSDQGIRTLAVCPGWVKTDMGGANATRNLPEGVASIVWAINTKQDGPKEGFFRDGSQISW